MTGPAKCCFLLHNTHPRKQHYMSTKAIGLYLMRELSLPFSIPGIGKITEFSKIGTRDSISNSFFLQTWFLKGKVF